MVARAIGSPERLPNSIWAKEAEAEAAEAEASEWRERGLELCLESLRRHESFLDSSWVSLLPFKPHSFKHSAHSLESYGVWPRLRCCWFRDCSHCGSKVAVLASQFGDLCHA